MTGLSFAARSLFRSQSRLLTLGGPAVVLGALVSYNPSMIAFVIPAIVMTLLLAATVSALSGPDTDARTRLLRWTMTAFCIHLVIGLVIWSNSGLTTYLGGDAQTYHGNALVLLQHWRHGTPMPQLPTGKEGFFYLLAGLYWVFGPYAAAGLAVNAGLAAAIIPLLYDVTRRQFGSDAARYVAPIAALLPGFLIWGSQLLREPVIYFLMAVSLNCAVRLSRRATLSGLLVMTMAIALLFTMRADVALLLAGGLVVGVAAGQRGVTGGLMTGLGSAALVFTLVLAVGLGYSGYRLVTHSSLADVSSVRTSSSTSAASGFLPEAQVSTPAHAAAYLPLGGTYFLMGPFPWQIGGLRQLPAVPDALLWWFLLPSLWRGFGEARRRLGRGVVLYVLPSVALTVVLSLLVANFGTTVRERMQVILILVPVLAAGWSIRPGRRGAGASERQLRQPTPTT